MRPLQLTPLFVPAALLAFALASSAPGCGQQGEGDRCDRAAGVDENGDADCAAGLVCTSASVLGTNSDICCPPDGSGTAPACIPGTLNQGGNANQGGASASSSSSASASSTGGAGGATTSAGGTGGTGGTTSASGGAGGAGGGGGA